jgi:hypothetical protein
MSAFHRIKALGLASAAEVRLLKRLTRTTSHGLIHDPVIDKMRAASSKEARCIHLARGFLKGRHHHEIENPLRPKDQGHISSSGYTRTHPDWDRVLELAQAYGKKLFGGSQELAQVFAEWRDHAIGVK